MKGRNFKIETRIFPGAPMAELLDRAHEDMKSMLNDDIFLIMGGTNDVSTVGVGKLARGISVSQLPE